MNGREARSEALEKVIRAVLAVLSAERSIAVDDRAAAAVPKRVEHLELSCRDLVNTVDDLPPAERPKGWETTPDGRTA